MSAGCSLLMLIQELVLCIVWISQELPVWGVCIWLAMQKRRQYRCYVEHVISTLYFVLQHYCTTWLLTTRETALNIFQQSRKVQSCTLLLVSTRLYGDNRNQNNFTASLHLQQAAECSRTITKIAVLHIVAGFCQSVR
jgi:hypothetical protein